MTARDTSLEAFKSLDLQGQETALMRLVHIHFLRNATSPSTHRSATVDTYFLSPSLLKSRPPDPRLKSPRERGGRLCPKSW